MVDYTYDETLYPRFDHADIVDSMPGDPDTAYIVKLYLTDGEIKEYGIYDHNKAKKVVDQIVDDNVNFKFPFLKKPLKAENVNVDAAVGLAAAVLESEKEAFIASARKLRSLGYRIPTSSKEFMEMDLNKEIKAELERIEKTLSLLDKEDEEDKKIYDRLTKKRTELESGMGGVYSQIRFMETGALGTLNILSGGFSPQEILKTWKHEALYGTRKVKRPYVTKAMKEGV